jgi:release factor glutamine methyltransferase
MRMLEFGIPIGDRAVARFLWFGSVVALIVCTGCRTKYREDLDYSYSVQQTLALDDLDSNSLVQFETVSWDADDQVELRSMIIDDNLAAGRDVLQIGVGPGVISILCLQHGANRIVATDANPAALANAKYNAAKMEVDADMEVRGSDDGRCFSAVKSAEKFDLIIVDSSAKLSWQTSENASDSCSADSFLDQLLHHLKPGGRSLVACHHSDLIDRWRTGATKRSYELKVLGQRDSASMTGQIYPAALLEIRIPIDVLDRQGTDGAE